MPQLDHSEGDCRPQPARPRSSDDDSRSTRRSARASTAPPTGPLFALPAGDANATFKVGARPHRPRQPRAPRRASSPAPTLAAPRARRRPASTCRSPSAPRRIGRLTANANAEVAATERFRHADRGRRGAQLGARRRGSTCITSFTREEGAPSLQQLGDPLLETANVDFFDAVTGQSVAVTTLTGGNPDLDADRRTVWKLGGNWQPSEKLDLRLRADFVHQSIDQPQIGFPAVDPGARSRLPRPLPARCRRPADPRRPAPGQFRTARAATRCAGASTSPSRSSPSPPSREQIAALARAASRQRAQPAAPPATDAGRRRPRSATARRRRPARRRLRRWPAAAAAAGASAAAQRRAADPVGDPHARPSRTS